ncbi:MAG: BLUF domain-containing protein [Patiriisocius sp.]|uniref:BLUF domain-containing protein n=1 Tax=Patiriisocius sp. TaxID=2822396 RepID=UPI003EF91F81
MGYTICYISKAKEGLTPQEIEDIFNKTYTKNSLKSITGILIHGMGNFFQILEGEKNEILPLFEDIIKKDARHADIFEVISKPKDVAIFANYRSHFNIIRTNEQLEDVKKYLREHDINTTTDKLQRLLSPFIL